MNIVFSLWSVLSPHHAERSNAPLFAMQLNYNDGTAPQYNGNIANQYWGTPGSLNKSYTYGYDKLNRLTSGVSNEGYNEQGIAYDVMGNITNLTRQTAAYAYNYNGNQLQSVSGLTSGTYGYDTNGNVNFDARIGSNVTYNYLNLPETITGNNRNLAYIYDAAGRKLRKSNGAVNTDYIGGIQYDNGTISFIQTEEGRAINSGNNNYTYEYQITDHLGNSRLNFDQNGATRQQDDYYPFGMNISRGTVSSPKNEYLYNRKELQEETGLYDYGARFYDPVIGRWNVVDPLAEISRRWSPYNYVMGNPISMVDPDGMAAEFRDGNEYYTGEDAVNYAKGIQAAENKNYHNPNAPDPNGRIIQQVNPKTGDPIAGILNEVTISDRMMNASEIYQARVDRGENPFSGKNGGQIKAWYEWHEVMYRDYTAKVHPAIEGITLNVNVAIGYTNLTGSIGYATAGSQSGAFWNWNTSIGYSSGIGAGGNLSYFWGYKTGDASLINYTGGSRGYDANLGVLSVGQSYTQDPQTFQRNIGYDTYSYGVGVGAGLVLQGGFSRSGWLYLSK